MVSKSKLSKEYDIGLLKSYTYQAPVNTNSYYDRKVIDPVEQVANRLTA